MKKQRHLHFLGQRDLRFEPLLQSRPRREIPIEIQTAFANGNDFRLRSEASHFRNRIVGAVPTVVRMDSSNRKKVIGALVGNPRRFLAARQTYAGDDHRPHAGSERSFDHVPSIRLE